MGWLFPVIIVHVNIYANVRQSFDVSGYHIRKILAYKGE